MDNIQDIQNKIFAGIIKKEDGVEIRRQEFTKKYKSAKLFDNEYYIFSVLIADFPRLEISQTFIDNFLRANRPAFEKSKNIDINRYKIGDNVDPYEEFIQSCLGLHSEYQRETISNSEYMEALEIYKMHYLNEKSIILLEESVKVLSEGITERGQLKVGYEGMRTHLKNGFLVLDELTNKTERKGLITYGINAVDDAELEKNKVKLIAKYGIPSLDKHLKGIYEGDMVSLLAPAKGGKSRMATYLLHQAVLQGVNIIMWSIENGYKGWEALIRARHFEYFYNEQLNDGSMRKFVDDDSIRKDTLPPDLKDMERASFTDLQYNTKYGKISVIDEDFDIDNFLEIMGDAVDTTGAQLICIDYLQLVQGSGRASKQEKVSEAYQKTLQFLKGRKIAGVFPGQLKQSVVGDLNKTDSADLGSQELRNAAGESYEVIKTPDVNLALYATVDDIANGRMKIMNVASRNASPFEPIDIVASLGSCSFYEPSFAGK